ncbi:MAG TPA: hypothetical protein VM369_05130 [Candidatus Binatia bacterium]|nr:hypothetical protein [Candidatus Binatia bacterium]
MLSRAVSSAVSLPSPTLWTELSALEPLRALGPGVLACVGYGMPMPDDPRCIEVGLPLLGAPRIELWRSARPVEAGNDEGIGFAHDGEVLMGQLSMLDCELDPVAPGTFRAYARIVAFLERQGYPHLLRCWNYLHAINEGDADRERYKQFCVGRYQAIAGSPGFERQLPAGTAIGMAQPGLLVYFLAARSAPGIQVENPRQTPAFHYPRQYGPRSPSFSRATLRVDGGEAQLLVSGTASVIGHATQHPDDMRAQLDETLANLQALLAHAGAAHLRGGAARWTAQSFKLYLRDRKNADYARQRLEQAFGSNAPLLLLEGDVCRRDLHTEIEAVYSAPLGEPSRHA